MTNEFPPVFIIIWVAWCIGLFLFLYINKDAKLKRKWWPKISIATAILFIFIIYDSGAPTGFILLAAAILAIITVLNIRAVKFCDACGKTLTSQNPFSPPEFCSKCGAKLHDESPVDPRLK